MFLKINVEKLPAKKPKRFLRGKIWNRRRIFFSFPDFQGFPGIGPGHGIQTTQKVSENVLLNYLIPRSFKNFQNKVTYPISIYLSAAKKLSFIH